VFKDQVITCFIKDDFGMEITDHLNLDMVTWESDYPHSDCTWPTSPETLMPAFERLSDDVINKITHENALRLWNFDPFRHIPKEEATVGARRANVVGWDTTTRSTEAFDRGEKMRTAGQINQLAENLLKTS
jgi:hypothetical protein